MSENQFNFALKVQSFESNKEKVLLIARSVSILNGNGWFKVSELKALFKSLRLPEPLNINQYLTRLTSSKYLIFDKKSKVWSFTPIGVEFVNNLMSSLNLDHISFIEEINYGSDFGHAIHSTIPPDFAPIKWQRGISQLLSQFPFESNVFLITRFPKDKNDTKYLDPISDAIDTIRDNLKASFGLNLHLASDRNIDDDLLGNVAAHMWACNYGIGIFEDRLGRGLNYNVVTEIGGMLMTGRRCALLKDETIKGLPSDFSGLIYKPIDIQDQDKVKECILAWVKDDLGFNNKK